VLYVGRGTKPNPTDLPLTVRRLIPRPAASPALTVVARFPAVSTPLHVPVRGLVAEHDDHRISTAPSYRLHAVALISEG
jgi:hypothetical protein